MSFIHPFNKYLLTILWGKDLYSKEAKTRQILLSQRLSSNSQTLYRQLLNILQLWWVLITIYVFLCLILSAKDWKVTEHEKYTHEIHEDMFFLDRKLLIFSS